MVEANDVGASLGLRKWVMPGCAGMLLLVCAGVLLLPAIQPARSGRRHTCTNHLKQIGIALQNYQDRHKCFPPAFTVDERGVPMHSWRVLILPHLEGPDSLALYEQYRFDESWNGPNNRKLHAKAPHVFRCNRDPSDESETSYLAVVGDVTVWPGTETVKLRQIDDSFTTTIIVAECSESGVKWLEPRDITFDDAAKGINRPFERPGIRSRHEAGGANAAFCDSHVSFLRTATPLDVLRALLTRNGGEPIEFDDSGDYKLPSTSEP